MKSIKKTTTIDEVAKILAQKDSIALFSHINPDGDTVGAAVALKSALQKSGKRVDMFCDSVLGSKLSHFEETKNILSDIAGNYDLLVAVDCSDVYRLGKFAEYYDRFAETMTIDHHGGEYFSKYNLLEKSASTCQIIYKVINALGVEIDANIATYLYMGVCTDTGNFSNSGTDSDSLLCAYNLLIKGADRERIVRILMQDITFSELKLRSKVISRMRSYYEGQMFLIYVTKSDLEEFNVERQATTGIVQYAIDIDTAKIGVCMTEYSENVYKVSMRGKSFCVRDVCKEFGGGGHRFASACMISGLLEDVIEKIVRAVGFYI